MTIVWSPVHLIYGGLPWLLVVALLVLAKPNRSLQAWWVWVPLLMIFVPLSLLGSILPFLPAEPLDMLHQGFGSLTLALGTAWLLSPYLGRKSGVATFFAVFLTLICLSFGYGLVAFGGAENPPLLVATLFIGFNAALAFALATVFTRKRYRPLRLVLWLIGWLVILWTATTSPFFLFAAVMGSEAPVFEFLAVILATAAATFLIFLPFLVLSFAQPLYRTRLHNLLRPAVDSTPGLAPAPAAGT